MASDVDLEGLLVGLEGEAREARRKLLAELAEAGVPPDELRRAVEEQRLAILPAERVLEGEGPRYDAAEVAERSGMDIGSLARYRQALGLPTPDPEERVFTDEDVESARRLRALRDAGLPEEGLLEAVRVAGIGMSQVAAAYLRLIAGALLRPGDTERDLAHRYADAARALAPLGGPALEYALHQHLLENLRRDYITEAELAAGTLPGAQEVTACFADLVGFTKLGERLEPEQLGEVTGRLAELTGDVVSSPVRLVKTLGDGVMLTSRDNDPLLEAALTLVEAADAEGEGFPQLRAGLARGPVQPRAGDFYGRAINLASRITGVARPGSVLCSEEVREATGEDGSFQWSFAGERHLKGVRGGVKVFRARRRARDAETG